VGYKYPPPKLVVTVLKQVFIGTTDLKSVLPRVTKNHDREGLSVVPAWAGTTEGDKNINSEAISVLPVSGRYY
jgi:hypothetical protein